MPRYLIEASYTADGAKGLLKEGGTRRRKTVEDLVKQLGGQLQSFDYALGSNDVYAIAEFPDLTTATAMSIAINSTGAVTLRTVPLLTAEEIDAATQKTVGYRPPGG